MYNSGKLIDELQGYQLILTAHNLSARGEEYYQYTVYDPFDRYVASKLEGKEYSSNDEEYVGSELATFFLTNVRKDKVKKAAEETKGSSSTPRYTASYSYPYSSFSQLYADRTDDDAYIGQPWSSGYKPYSYYAPKNINIEDYCKSDTIVFHLRDASTTMLSQIYEGKGFDVISDSSIGENNVKTLLERHDRVICLGHGTSAGLIGGNITGAVASYLKDKKLFVIWCNADEYFSNHHIGDGQFITGNMPSEVSECHWAGCGDISRELMLENITYWSKLCADVCEQALNGDAVGAVKYVRENYIKKYGDHPVTIYNAERTKVQGTSMAQNIAEVDEIKKALGFDTPDHVDSPRSPYSYYYGSYSDKGNISSKSKASKPSKKQVDKSIEDLFSEIYNSDDDYYGD